MTKAEWFKAHGFDEEGLSLCVFGDDTYAIKDWLKEQGFKFDPLFKWHGPEYVELPVGYHTFVIDYKDYMEWDSNFGTMMFYEDAKSKMEEHFQRLQGPSTAEYYPGIEGERVHNITAIYKSRRGFEGMYGYTNIFTFEAGSAVLVWFTATNIELKPGTAVDLSFTIKKFEEFRGVKTTQITRAKVVPFEEP